MDRVWWDKYRNDVAHIFYGRRISPNKSVPGTDFIDFYKGGNSGAGAMSLAKYFGATRIILLGYDCKYADCGKRHWHGDHPRGLGNAVSMPTWMPQFAQMAKHLKGVEVVNCSRETAIEFFRRGDLDNELGEGEECKLRAC